MRLKPGQKTEIIGAAIQPGLGSFVPCDCPWSKLNAALFGSRNKNLGFNAYTNW